MNKTSIGISFLFMATILYATRFICGAIGRIGATTWGEKDFARYMSHIPISLMIVTIIALSLGIGFFVWGLIQSLKNQ
ncbi:hypothetical protein [Alteribacillus sp. HJP-4]|uniref:hypothetical protein n=1 Tax=Alteribacillus sp. HJP-4 TaxID=2775394 RepID=UPI0035CD092F